MGEGFLSYPTYYYYPCYLTQVSCRKFNHAQIASVPDDVVSSWRCKSFSIILYYIKKVRFNLNCLENLPRHLQNVFQQTLTLQLQYIMYNCNCSTLCITVTAKKNCCTRIKKLVMFSLLKVNKSTEKLEGYARKKDSIMAFLCGLFGWTVTLSSDFSIHTKQSWDSNILLITVTGHWCLVSFTSKPFFTIIRMTRCLDIF